MLVKKCGKKYVWTLLAFIMAAGCTSSPPSPYEQLTHKQLPHFRIPEELQLEIIAAEPLLVNPLYMEVDEYGRLFVLEATAVREGSDYTARISQLIDTNLDGYPDQRLTFADGLASPTGMLRWKNGFLLTSAASVSFLADTNDDQQADMREVLFEARHSYTKTKGLHAPVLGIDNQVYIANGYIDSLYCPLSAAESGKGQIFSSEGRSMRLLPDSVRLSPTASQAHFGHGFDPSGNYFVSNDSCLLGHEVVAYPYLLQNPPLLSWSAVQCMLADSGSSGQLPGMPVAPGLPLLEGPMFHIYEGAHLGAAYSQVVLVSQPGKRSHIRAFFLEQDKSSFRLTSPDSSSLFFSSNDSTFYPSGIFGGPDGALYILDYSSAPNQGRIYRLSQKNSAPFSWLGRLLLGKSSVSSLVQTLETPNVWWRKQAQRLLLHREDTQMREALFELIKNSEFPLAKVHALWTLQHFQLNDPISLDLALKDPDAVVRRHAIKITEIYRQRHPVLLRQLLKMTTEKDPQVRLQLLCSLGFSNHSSSNLVRRYLLNKDIADHWVHLAALSSMREIELPTLIQLVSDWEEPTASRQEFIEEISRLIGQNAGSETIEELLAFLNEQAANRPWWLESCIRGLRQGINEASSPVELSAVRIRQLSRLSELF